MREGHIIGLDAAKAVFQVCVVSINSRRSNPQYTVTLISWGISPAAQASKKKRDFALCKCRELSAF